MTSFNPEPQDRSDLVFKDKEGFEHHVHSIILANRSKVFRDLDWTQNQIATIDCAENNEIV
jgi:hypothetical protein